MKTLTEKPSSLFMVSLQNIESTNLFSICGYRDVTCFDKIDEKDIFEILRSDSEFKTFFPQAPLNIFTMKTKSHFLLQCWKEKLFKMAPEIPLSNVQMKSAEGN